MDETNQKTVGPIVLPGPGSSTLPVSRRAISFGWAVFFVLTAWAATDALANSLKGKTTVEKEKEIQPSVFVVPSSLKEGRNPFYPHSTRGMMIQQSPVRTAQPVADVSELVLNGIVPSGPVRTAMINGRTFEVGEQGEVRLPDGQKLPVKVDEIKEDSVMVTVKGQHRELRLRRGL